MKFIFFGFIAAYNPFYLYYLMSHSALGGISRRIIVSSVFLITMSYFSLLVYFLNGHRKIKIQKSSILFSVNTLLIFYIVSNIVGMVKGNNVNYMIIDSFPLWEMFMIYYLIKFSPLMKNRFDFAKTIKWFLIYFFLMSLTNLVSYGVLSFVKGASFGALRAYISGSTVNRLMDFVLPLFFPLLVLSYEKLYRRKVVMILLLGMSVLVVALTFYRTIYLAVFAGFCYLAISNRKRFFSMARLSIFLVVLSSVSLLGWNLISKHEGHNIGSLVGQSMKSIYSPDKKVDTSMTSRIKHSKEIIFNILKEFPAMAGMGGTYESYSGEIIPIYTTSNYFLQLILLLGIPAGLLFIWLYFQTFFLSRRLSREVKNISEKVFFSASACILVSLGVILCLFPYTCYFPLLYILGFILGVADRQRELLKSKMRPKSPEPVWQDKYLLA